MSKRSRTAAAAASFDVSDSRYAAWIAYAFDRPVTEAGWYFDCDLGEGFEAGPVETVGLIGRTMARSGTDLGGFSDAQVYHGLTFMLSEIHDQADCFGDDKVPIENRVAAIKAFKHLYKDCFEPRCLSCLGHLSEGCENRLNMLAYMLWDTISIRYRNDHLAPVIEAIFDVWDFALGSPNGACIESALHGLGHAALKHRAQVHRVIDHFLASTCDADEAPRRPRDASARRRVRPELRAYARQARTGMIL